MLPRLDLSSHTISLELVNVTFYKCLPAALSPLHRKLVGMDIPIHNLFSPAQNHRLKKLIKDLPQKIYIS